MTTEDKPLEKVAQEFLDLMRKKPAEGPEAIDELKRHLALQKDCETWLEKNPI